MVQEYGRYFDMPPAAYAADASPGQITLAWRCMDLSFLIKCNVEGREYSVYGYKGEQVRDDIHSEDVARFMFEFYKAPRIAEVYNLGGGKENSCSILEAFRKASAITGRAMKWRYADENRIG